MAQKPAILVVPAQSGRRPGMEEFAGRLVNRIGEIHDSSGLWSHIRRDPKAFVEAVMPILEALKQTIAEAEGEEQFFEGGSREAACGFRRAWLGVTPALLEELLELPDHAQILSATYSHNMGSPLVELLVEHADIPLEAHKVMAEYTRKSRFDRFVQTRPFPEPESEGGE